MRSIKRDRKQGQKWYDCNRWTGITDRPTEDELWNWLSRFQTEFLTGSSNLFCAARHTRELQGAEAKRQLDVLVKKRARSDACGKHDWKDILVLGELKQYAQDFKSLLLQLTRYVRDIYTAQPLRHFLHAFTIQGTIMEQWAFDRSGSYSSGEFDIHQELGRFIKAILGYANMSDAELGLDTYIEEQGTNQSITIRSDLTGRRTKCCQRQHLSLSSGRSCAEERPVYRDI